MTYNITKFTIKKIIDEGNMMDISDRIYLLRTDQGLSQSKFATATGSSTSTISKIETRKAIISLHLH